MGEIIKFPGVTNSNNEEKKTNEEERQSQFLKFEQRVFQEAGVIAFLSQSHPFVAEGNEVIVKINGKKYTGVVTSILNKDSSNNVTRISYSVPFLNGDDPCKFGEADFIYKLETHD